MFVLRRDKYQKESSESFETCEMGAVTRAIPVKCAKSEAIVGEVLRWRAYRDSKALVTVVATPLLFYDHHFLVLPP
jgi:hypothetical protein